MREDLNKVAPRRMAVLDPIKVTITNWPGADHVEQMLAVNNPGDPDAGKREVPLAGEVYIERGRLHGRPAEEVLPAQPGRGGAPALLLLRQV